jgi:hypothetical protein
VEELLDQLGDLRYILSPTPAETDLLEDEIVGDLQERFSVVLEGRAVQSAASTSTTTPVVTRPGIICPFCDQPWAAGKRV